MSITLKCLPACSKCTSADFDRVLVVLFFFVEIADARAVVDAGRAGDGAGEVQHLIDQRGLAGRAVAAEEQCCGCLRRCAWP